MATAILSHDGFEPQELSYLTILADKLGYIESRWAEGGGNRYLDREHEAISWALEMLGAELPEAPEAPERPAPRKPPPPAEVYLSRRR